MRKGSAAWLSLPHESVSSLHGQRRWLGAQLEWH
jgi:hypothetical protein